MLQGENHVDRIAGKDGEVIKGSKIKTKRIQRVEGPADRDGNYPTIEVEEVYTPRQLAQVYKRSTKKYPTYHTNTREFGTADDEGRDRFGGRPGPASGL
jgi:hypothetical protein